MAGCRENEEVDDTIKALSLSENALDVKHFHGSNLSWWRSDTDCETKN